jgi:tetratricopeptide (TPR) repeat protein
MNGKRRSNRRRKRRSLLDRSGRWLADITADAVWAVTWLPIAVWSVVSSRRRRKRLTRRGISALLMAADSTAAGARVARHLPSRLTRFLGRSASTAISGGAWMGWLVLISPLLLARRIRHQAPHLLAQGKLFVYQGISFPFRLSRRAWQSVPAIVAAATIIATVIWVVQVSPAELSANYQQAAERALQSRDLTTAAILYRKLASLNEAGVRGKYGLAIVAEQQGDRRRAAQLMRQIAPEDGRGHAAAHFWLALHLARSAGDGGGNIPDRPSDIENHLLRTVESEPNHLAARRMLGDLYARRGHPLAAIEHYSRVVDVMPECRLSVAQQLALVRRHREARRQGEWAAAHFAEQFRESPSDVNAAIGLARCKLFLGHPEQAVQILASCLELTGDDRLDEELSRIYVAWFDRTSPADTEQQLELLRRALECNPENELAVERFQAFVGRAQDIGQRAEMALAKAATSGRPGAIANWILGSLAFARDDAVEARRYLESAYQLDRSLPLVANNLAWLLAETEPRDLERALRLANEALALAPERPEIRETRGQVLAKLGRYRECITDLEHALRFLPNMPQIHETLALAWDELGDRELAELHRTRGTQGRPSTLD